MSEQPLIFDLGRRPTTRALALDIRARGDAALDQAQLRADAARYQEVTCRSALNAVKGMPFNWTLNPYRGCTHACHYCFARRYQNQFELGVDDHFSSVILVKINLVDVLKRELDKPSWEREQVAVGTATDPYQPIEGHYKLTRRSLEALVVNRPAVLACVDLQRLVEAERLSFTANVQAVAAGLVQRLDRPQQPGLGVEIDRAALAHYSVP